MKRREKALIFEDLDSDWESLRRALNHAGFDVVRARTPEDFLGYAPYRDFDLILVDIFLGKLPDAREVGIDLTREVKKVNRDIPVLVVSDFEPNRMIVADAFRAGARDYLDKKEFLGDVLNVTKRVRADLNDHQNKSMEEEFPLPMAFLFRDYLYSHTTSKRRIERMVELFEVTLKLVTFPLLAVHGSELKTHLSPKLREELARPSLGHFVGALNDLPDTTGFLRSLSKISRNKRFRALCEKFIVLRNNFAHGISQPDRVYERLIDEHDADLKELLGMLDCLRQCQLIWPSKAEIEDDYHVYDEARILRGSYPEPTPTPIRTKLVFKFTKHIHLVDEAFSESVDLFPWCQYLYCEQVCLNRKLFLYRLARQGELLTLDHIYGHSLQTREGWKELKEMIGDN